jgi:hypothetical protein
MVNLEAEQLEALNRWIPRDPRDPREPRDP